MSAPAPTRAAHVLRAGGRLIDHWRVSAEGCAVLSSSKHLRLKVLVTHCGIDHPEIEPVNSTYAADSLRMLYEHAESYRTVLYRRPSVPGPNDSDEHIERARELSLHAHVTVFRSLLFRDETKAYHESHGMAAGSWAVRPSRLRTVRP